MINDDLDGLLDVQCPRCGAAPAEPCDPPPPEPDERGAA